MGLGLLMAVIFWAIFKGLTIIKAKRWSNVILETDSTEAFRLITDAEIENNPNRAILEDCKYLMERLRVQPQHTLRQGR